MTETKFPGVYIEEISTGSHPIEGVPTSTAGFVGIAQYESGPRLIESLGDLTRRFECDDDSVLALAVRGFFENGGLRCFVSSITAADHLARALDDLGKEQVSILCCPDEHRIPDAASILAGDCERRRDRICLLHSPTPSIDETHRPAVRSAYAAYYHPWLEVERGDGDGTITIPPGGHMCGVLARAEAEHGASAVPRPSAVLGVQALSQTVTAPAAERLASLGVNVLRALPGRGVLAMGARTTSDDPEWRYVAVRRLLIFIEQSLQQGLQWAVSEPNGPVLWANVRAAAENFLLGVWRSGGLVGSTPNEALFARCDRSTMSQADIDAGQVIAIVGVATLRPAEFVILRIGITLGTAGAQTATLE